jgi:two-component system, chemotaxis family, chemotaxis protein CheV
MSRLCKPWVCLPEINGAKIMGAILLESGTNEVEIFEYLLGRQGYGINVLKVQQILEYNDDIVTETPDSGNSVIGVVMHQNNSIPLLDMAKYLGKKESAPNAAKLETDRRLIIVTEFNRQVNGILVDGVNKIHRISWDNIKSASITAKDDVSKLVGVCHIDNRQMMLLDYENIFSEVIGSSKLEWESAAEHVIQTEESKQERAKKHILVADDSALIRTQILKTLKSLGFTDVLIFDNGKSLLEAFEGLAQKASNQNCALTDLVDLVLTDIEMPRMDGLTLCKNIKAITMEVPVVVLSSLINRQMIEKCRSVHADNYLSKKEIPRLSEILDQVFKVAKKASVV